MSIFHPIRGYGISLVLASVVMVVVAAAKSAETASEGNRTLSNLNVALRGETNASHRYELFAQKADEENYDQVAKLFRAVSMSESIHRNNHKAAILSMGHTPSVINFAKVNVQTTRQNLEGPVKGEKFEKDILYPDFIRQAKKDKADEARYSFEYAQQAEGQHNLLFEKALKELGKNTPVDYCVSAITGSTIAVRIGQTCPKEPMQRRYYIPVR